MQNSVTITKMRIELRGNAEKYFHEVAYSLDYGDGKSASDSQVISHCLEELALFEKIMGESVTAFIASVKDAQEVSKTKEGAITYLKSQGLNPDAIVKEGMKKIKKLLKNGK